MKQYAGMGVNFAKTLKFDESDSNESTVFAELNLITSETKYELNEAGNAVKFTELDEVELIISASNARQLAEQLEDIADKLEELESREEKRDQLWVEHNK